MQLKPISQQVVVIVGASSGIGRESAIQFAKKGAKVVVAARSQPGLDSLVAEIKAMGGEAIAVVADVSDFEQVQAIAHKAALEYGRIDTWVHVAGVSLFAPFEELTPDEFKRIIDVNLNGQAYGAMAALPYLKQQNQGALIHVSSIASRVPFAMQSAYAASKHGITGFLDSLRIELRYQKKNISVTNVMPAIINTPIFDKMMTKVGVKPRGVPPYYHPSLVADAILYAAENPMRDFIVGDVGRFLDICQRISPALVDAGYQFLGIPAQITDKPKSQDDPNNLYEPMSEHDTVEGRFDGVTINTSVTDWLVKNPPVQWGVIGFIALCGLAAMNKLTSSQG
jgi:NAD(P)-dependent dehydrogenase (short-subunit alcohol dehydrogenase family)